MQVGPQPTTVIQVKMLLWITRQCTTKDLMYDLRHLCNEFAEDEVPSLVCKKHLFITRRFYILGICPPPSMLEPIRLLRFQKGKLFAQAALPTYLNNLLSGSRLPRQPPQTVLFYSRPVKTVQPTLVSCINMFSCEKDFFK